MNQARFQKRQREKQREERAAEKSARRQQRSAERDDAPTIPTAGIDQAAALAELAALHERFDAGAVELDDFLAERDAITQQLAID